MFECTDVSFSYGDNNVLHDVSFHIKKEEIVTLLGSSGCGKTTVFRLMTGLEHLRHGTMTIFDEPICDGHHKITYMMQEDLLLPWRNVWDNLMLIEGWIKPKPDIKEFRKKVRALLEEVGLVGCEDKYPSELSGGMRQRVALARALLQERPLLLLDEPFGALDVITREQMYQLLLDIRERRKISILLVTHDFKDALFLSDRIYLLGEEKGIYEEVTVPENLQENPKEWVAMQDSLKHSMMQNKNQQIFEVA
jgi:ABC-type nitrate/sulfonate/bicarbonate transport system ATPase subunit